MSEDKRVTIIMLNLNQEDDTVECLESLGGLTNKDYNVILLDNGSTDGSGYRIKERFKDIEFLRSEDNLGFAKGCNFAIRHYLKNGAPDYAMFLNNDTKVEANLLNNMLDVAQADEKIGIIGAVNYYYYRPDTIHMAGHHFIWWLGRQGKVLDVDTKFREVQSVSACCMLIKRQVIEKIGLFDEHFFAYYEDSDFCFRARQDGFKVAVARDAKVWHKVTTIFGLKTPAEYYIYTRNQPLFMLKHCPRIFLMNFFIIYLLKISIRIIYYFLTFRIHISRAIWIGFVDFLMGNFSKGSLEKFINV